MYWEAFYSFMCFAVVTQLQQFMGKGKRALRDYFRKTKGSKKPAKRLWMKMQHKMKWKKLSVWCFYCSMEGESAIHYQICDISTTKSLQLQQKSYYQKSYHHLKQRPSIIAGEYTLFYLRLKLISILKLRCLKKQAYTKDIFQPQNFFNSFHFFPNLVYRRIVSH